MEVAVAASAARLRPLWFRDRTAHLGALTLAAPMRDATLCAVGTAPAIFSSELLSSSARRCARVFEGASRDGPGRRHRRWRHTPTRIPLRRALGRGDGCGADVMRSKAAAVRVRSCADDLRTGPLAAEIHFREFLEGLRLRDASRDSQCALPAFAIMSHRSSVSMRSMMSVGVLSLFSAESVGPGVAPLNSKSGRSIGPGIQPTSHSFGSSGIMSAVAQPDVLPEKPFGCNSGTVAHVAHAQCVRFL